MSQYLANLDLDSFINVRGPFGNLEYVGNGECACFFFIN